MTVLEFLNLYEAEKHDIVLTSIGTGNRVVAIEVSFNKKAYNRGNFASIIDFVYEQSRHSAWIIGDWSNFYYGSSTIKLNVASKNYSSDLIVQMLKKLTGEIFPKLKKSTEE